jgi:hypothetical protein
MLTSMQITVYDPAFHPSKPPVYDENGSIRRLRQVPGWALVGAMRRAINESGRKVVRVQGGGRGNADGLCRPMSYRWVLEEMIGAMDPDSASLTQHKTWVEVKP